jgi:tRNA dimethylallyltransferase
VFEITGLPFGAGLPDEKDFWWPDTRVIGVRAPRDLLIERLDDRVVNMWRGGLLNEVEQLISLGIERGVTASRAIGYSQAIAQLNGSLTETEAIESTQALTRKYARRQVSWFRRYPTTHWLDFDDPARREVAFAVASASSALPTANYP